MTDHFLQTPILSKQSTRREIAIKTVLLLPLTLLCLIGSPPSTFAAIISPIQFQWDYDTTLPGLMGYTIYKDNQPIANIPDPYTLSTELDVSLDVGAQNTFTITAYDNLGNVSNPSLPYLIDVPPEDASGNIPPVAYQDISPVNGPAPFTVDVSASRSIDYDGMIIAYAWDLGDGGFSNYENDFYTFDAPGTYTVILDVTDDSGSLSTAEKTVTVTDPQATTNEPPTALLYTTTNNGPAPLDVLFDGTDSTDSDGIITDYLWDFGDGNSASGSFVNYTYTAIGIFTGQLSVTDDGGASATDQTEITVAASDILNNPPSAVINAGPLTGAPPLTTSFSGVESTDGDGAIVAYNWDFGDGSTASGAEVSHLYTSAGTYTAILTVTDNLRESDQAQTTISVTEETSATTVGYSDDFSTDSSSSYTNLSGTLAVANGAAHGSNWQTTLAYHNLSLGSNDHWLEAEVAYSGVSDSAGLIGRVDPVTQTGYAAYFANGKINLNRFAGTSQNWLATVDGPYAAGTYALRLVITGSTIQVFVDGVLKIQKSDTTYTSGQHAGFRIYRGNANTDVTADNLRAGTGSPPQFPQENNPPVAQDIIFTTQENSAVKGTFIAADLDGDPLTFAIVTNGSLGTAVITNPETGTYTYTPNAGVSGSDSFSYKANDGTTDSNTAIVTVTIEPAATSDLADDFSLDTAADYTNISGQITVLNGVAHGQNWQRTIALHNSPLASSDHWAEAVVTYSGASDSAGVLGRVDTANNTGYLASFSAGSLHLNSFAGSSLVWLASQDGAYQAGSYHLRMELSGSTINVYVDGVLKIEKSDSTYQTGQHAGLYFYRGSANSDITADNFMASSSSAPPAQEANRAPVATDGTLSLQEDTTASGTFTASDPEGDALTYTIIDSGSLGAAVLTDPATGAFTYTPKDNVNGSDRITFQASDGSLTSNIASVTVTIIAVNDPPVARDGTLVTSANSAASSTLVADDVDNDVLNLTIVSNGTLGTAVITDPASGTYTYTPNAGVSGSDSFTFQASDGEVVSNIATINVTIEADIASAALADDFSINTSADYTSISGSLRITKGAAHGQNWRRTIAYHNKDLGSSDHWVEADVEYNGAADSAGVIARVNTTSQTGYLASFSAGQIQLNSFSGQEVRWLASQDGGFKADTYRVRIKVDGSSIEVYVNDVLQISKTDSTHTTGNHVGIYIYRGSANTDVAADNFQANLLTR